MILTFDDRLNELVFTDDVSSTVESPYWHCFICMIEFQNDIIFYCTLLCICATNQRKVSKPTEFDWIIEILKSVTITAIAIVSTCIFWRAFLLIIWTLANCSKGLVNCWKVELNLYPSLLFIFPVKVYLDFPPIYVYKQYMS